MEQRQQPSAMSSSSNPADDPHHFYRAHQQNQSGPDALLPEHDDSLTPLAGPGMSADYGVTPLRSFEHITPSLQPRSVSGPATSNPTRNLNSVKSNPVLLPSRPSGSVRDIANRYNQTGTGQPQLSVRTSSQERHRKPIAGSKSSTPRSPIKGGKSDMVKLQKRRPAPKSPTKPSPNTSFNTSSSFGSDTTLSSTRSKPLAAFSPRKAPPTGVFTNPKPLFGEITADGQWNGNFDIGNYGQLPSYNPSPRRSSDGSVALSHGRSQSHQDFQRTALSPPVKQTLTHKRSRSEMDMIRPYPAPSMPELSDLETPSFAYPTPPHSGSRTSLAKDSPSSSRIPTRIRRLSAESVPSGPQSRSASAMSNPTGRRRLSKSPTRKQPPQARENAPPSSLQNRRYNPPSLPTLKSNQTLSAKIVAPLPQKSPPLRSSRPRQPVSSATTSASRARAAERFDSSSSRDGRRPSEQWLGKPYDPQKERTRRRIPELGKVDFAERRARIQKAISQSLDENKSETSSRSGSRSRSRNVSGVGVGLEPLETIDSVDTGKVMAEDRAERTEESQTQSPPSSRPRGLSLDTTDLPEPSTHEPLTADTEFEADEESPILGKPTQQQTQPNPRPMETRENPLTDLGTLLSSDTYTPQTKANIPKPIDPVMEAPEEEVQSPSVLENVMKMRERRSSSHSRSGTEFADDSTADYSPSDIGDRWGLESSAGNDAGSIKIMLDNEPTGLEEHDGWSEDAQHAFEHSQDYPDKDSFARSQEQNAQAFAANQFSESPVDGTGEFGDSSLEETPRKASNRDETLKPSTSQLQSQGLDRGVVDDFSDESTKRFLEQYQETGTVTSEMVQEMQRRMIDVHHASANEGSNVMMVQNLLDGILQGGVEEPKQSTKEGVERGVQYDQYGIPVVTPDTPPDADIAAGTAVVYSNDTSYEGTPRKEEDFDAVIKRADEEWSRKQRGEDTVTGAEDEDFRPQPPPKDYGYSPRSSTGPLSADLSAPDLSQGLRISTSGHLDLPELQSTGGSAANTPIDQAPPSPKTAPPAPAHAPPPPPSPSVRGLNNGMPEMTQLQSSNSERPSNEMSPRIRKNLWGPTPSSSRPSTDSQRQPPPLPSSVSMSSFADSARQGSMGDADSSSGGKAKSPGPEQKRLQKRRFIIRELLDTEATYHQDLKIIEDIYKATAGELISADDKKTLFGNCDEIEKFSLYFFDEMRKCVSSVYVPPKKNWSSKRNSMSTMQSDGTGATSTNSNDVVDEDRDRQTSIGECFIANMQTMEEVYGTYLRNHDAANMRLGVLQSTPTVKCWLDECHNNASDITSAWNLDSLLVKPAQRVAKYPMLIQQLCETTPADHPDFAALTAASKDCISMLTRINDAKKRADLVDNLINRKRKDSDMRSGIAKAFGRRTEKLKERVGIAEAFQDPEFDELAHKFGGHFIRLQICMRDIQDYITRTDKAFDQINNYVAALELFADVQSSHLPEITSKWRRYGQAVREITTIALGEHKAYVSKRVIQPLIQCIKLHDGPQNAINQRKKRIVDYAKCKSIEKRGEKPDKKTKEASDRYEALNEELKVGLPKLYKLTGVLVQRCLCCFLQIQVGWLDTWKRKLEPVLDASDLPGCIDDIEPAFRPDYEAVKAKLMELGLCNGSTLADSYNFLSPTVTLHGDSSEQSSLKRPSTVNDKRTMSMSSEVSPSFEYTRPHSGGGYLPSAYNFDGAPPMPTNNRMRSNSSMSGRNSVMPALTPASTASTQRPWSNSNTSTAHAVSYSGRPTSSSTTHSRPSTGNIHGPPTSLSQMAPSSYGLPPRTSFDSYTLGHGGSSTRARDSNATYFTARPDLHHSTTDPLNNQRFSGIFSSALPPSDESSPQMAATPASQTTPSLSRASSTTAGGAVRLHKPSSSRRNTATSTSERNNSSSEGQPNVLFVCASLFEFNIDKARKEGGYPYLTYVQGEVFDVIAQKGELWLARNQDDARSVLGWIWEQHFVVLSQDG